jgi:hypothetical protein
MAEKERTDWGFGILMFFVTGIGFIASVSAVWDCLYAGRF